MIDDADPGSRNDPIWVPEAIPAATVITVRDGSNGIETLMLRRDGKLAFAGGMWVFPGGRIENDDASAVPGSTPDEHRLEAASRVAAVRETLEETGLVLDPAGLIRWSHWTAPVQSPRRFTTAFYVGAVGSGDAAVVIDHGEIQEYRWQRPADAIADRDRGIVGLTPPTFISLVQIGGYHSVAALIRAASLRAVEHFATRFEFLGETAVAMYHGDAGYSTGDPGRAGPRHRLVMDVNWRYERDT